MSPNLTPHDKLVLKGLCSDPWANDRQLSEALGSIQSTVTACKRRLKGQGVFRKAYLPAYQRLGYPVLSISQLRMDRPSEASRKAFLKYQDARLDKDIGSIVSFMTSDPMNCLVMAHHRDYSAFKTFERIFGHEQEWSHQVFAMHGATAVVDFDYTNLINKLFFPEEFKISTPGTIDTAPYRFHKIEKTVFDGLLAYPDKFFEALAKKTGVTRQSVVKMQKRFRAKGILARRTLLDLKGLDLQILTVLQFKMKDATKKDLADIDRILCPFYYWAFDDDHFLMFGSIDHSDLTVGLEKLSRVPKVGSISSQCFDVRTGR